MRTRNNISSLPFSSHLAKLYQQNQQFNSTIKLQKPKLIEGEEKTTSWAKISLTQARQIYKPQMPSNQIKRKKYNVQSIIQNHIRSQSSIHQKLSKVLP